MFYISIIVYNKNIRNISIIISIFRVPVYLLYISTVYGILSLIGIILCVEKPKESDSSKIKEKKVDIIK